MEGGRLLIQQLQVQFIYTVFDRLNPICNGTVYLARICSRLKNRLGQNHKHGYNIAPYYAFIHNKSVYLQKIQFCEIMTSAENCKDIFIQRKGMLIIIKT